jgi:hypothetical protein
MSWRERAPKDIVQKVEKSLRKVSLRSRRRKMKVLTAA